MIDLVREQCGGASLVRQHSTIQYRVNAHPPKWVAWIATVVAVAAMARTCGWVLDFFVYSAYIHLSGRLSLPAILTATKYAASHISSCANKGGRMNAYGTRNLRFVLAVLISIGIWGCAAKPFDPPQTGEIPTGPGVFSKGDDGAVLYDSNEKRSERRAAALRGPAAQGDTGQSATVSSASDYAEFEAYQQFRAWKKSAVGTEEYEEFQQWRQWQQYRQWKQNQ
jgi:hypothetical protein